MMIALYLLPALALAQSEEEGGAGTSTPEVPHAEVPHQEVPHAEMPHQEMPHQEQDPEEPPSAAPPPAEEPPAEEPPAEEPPQPGQTRAPVLLQDAVPDYPVQARDLGIQGDVILLVTVQEDGSVGEVEVVQLPHELLKGVSLEAAHRLRFAPALYEGQPAAVQLHYRFRFDLGLADEQGTAVPGSLYGQVQDPDGLSVPSAQVRILNLDDPDFEILELTARADGSFRAPFLPTGRYKLVLEHPSFNPSEVEFSIAAGQNLQRAFVLYPTSSHEIVVTYETRTWREVERAPLEEDRGTVTGSYSLTRRDVEANPGSMEDVSRAVHTLPGVVSDGDMLATFHARGGETDDVVFMLDRVPLQNPYHLAGFNSLFNPDMISQVSYYAGTAPADVPAATSAVLAVETWDGSPRQDARDMDGALDISASSLRAHVMGPISENASFALAARRSYLESYFWVMEKANVLDTAFAAPEYSEVSGRFAWRPSERHRLIATAMHAGDSLALVDSEDESLVDFEGSFELDNKLSLFSLDHEYTPNEEHKLHSTTAWTRDRAYLLRDLGGEYREDATTHRWFGRTDLYANLERHRLASGVDFSYLWVRSTGQVEDPRANPRWYNAPMAEYDHPVVELDSELRYPEGSFYLQDTWEGPLHVRLGGRGTLTGATGELLLSPRAGVSLPLPSGTVPKLSWGIYHKIPRDPRIYDADLGNPDIKSERAVHWVAGFDQGFPLPGEEAGGLLRLEGYYIQLSDLVVSPDNWEAINEGTSYTNDGSGTNRGIDAMLGARAGRVQGLLTYSFLIAWRENPLNEVFPTEYAPAQDQRHTLGAAFEYQLTPRWRTTLRYSFHSGRLVSSVEATGEDELFALSSLNDQRLGNFHNIDVRAEWRKALQRCRMSFYVEVLNVTNFQSDFVPIVAFEDGQRVDSMFYHLPIRPFIGVRADF